MAGPNTDVDVRGVYRLTWERIRELEDLGRDLTDLQDEVERAYEARDYAMLADAHDWLEREIRAVEAARRSFNE